MSAISEDQLIIEQIYFWDELIYLAALPLTKISILLFYLKIFPKREIKIAVWVLIGLNIGYFIAFEIISIWQCTPIQGAWLHWDGTFEATCRDINMQGWVCFIFLAVLSFLPGYSERHATCRDCFLPVKVHLCNHMVLTQRISQMAAGLNLALDLAVLILPLPELARLSMSWRKKLQILSMFCVGFLYVFFP